MEKWWLNAIKERQLSDLRSLWTNFQIWIGKQSKYLNNFILLQELLIQDDKQMEEHSKLDNLNRKQLEIIEILKEENLKIKKDFQC